MNDEYCEFGGYVILLRRQNEIGNENFALKSRTLRFYAEVTGLFTS